MVRAIVLIIMLFSLSGCFLTTGPGLFAASTAVFINTKKTLSDHAMSWMTGQDCSTLEYTKGKGYCLPMEGEEPPAAAANLAMGSHCYRTLGRVTCYTQPDDLASDYARLQ